ncbi:MAG: Hsp70 family protein [Planctomycetota bacterium]|nr:Hsp70 family protein [Planctomycetota bacterium]
MPELVCGQNGCSWVIAPDHDVYCGLCGTILAKMEVTPRRLCIYSGMPEWENPVHFTLKNAGRIQVEIGGVDLCNEKGEVLPRARPEENWARVKLDGPARRGRSSRLMMPQATGVLTARSLKELVGADREFNGSIVVRTSIGPVEVPIQILPEFDFSATARPDLLVGSGRHSVEVTLEGLKGEAILTGITTGVPWAEVGSIALPQHLKRGGTIIVPLTVSGADLAQSKGHAVPLLVYVQEREEPIGKEVPVTHADPPLLELKAGERIIRLLEGEVGKSCEWLFSNVGGVGLAATAVEVKLVGSSAPTAFLTCRIPNALPVAVDPGGQLRVLLDPLAAELPPGRYEVGLMVPWHCAGRTDKGGVARASITVIVEALTPEGLAAIDFGTTSSCCAIWDPDAMERRLVELETRPELTPQERCVTPTAVVYTRDASDPRGVRAYEFGWPARADADKRHYRNRSCLSVKRELGQNARHSIRAEDDFLAELSSEEIAADILRDLKNKIVWNSLRHAPETLVVTVPAMFWWFEREALKRAVRLAGLPPVDDDQFIIEEPIAAAAGFFFDEAHVRELKLPETYTLLACDIGGGTTDVCLLSVKDLRDERHVRHLAVEILVMGGNPKFGGDDITWSLARRIRDLAVGSGRDIPYEGVGASHSLQGAENTAALRQLAEECKIALSEANEAPVPGVVLDMADGFKYRVDPNTLKLKRGDIEDAVREPMKVLDVMIAGLIEEATRRYGLTFRNGCPDMLFLTGRTMNIPCIRERLMERFGKNGHEFDQHHCKDCTVEGAIRVYHYETSAGRTGEIEFAYHRKDSCSPVAVGIAAARGDGNGLAFVPIIRQFEVMEDTDDVSRWPTISVPRPRVTSAIYEIYRNYAPGYNEMRPDNPFMQHLGTTRIPVPEKYLERNRAPGDTRLFQLSMKLERSSRRLIVRASVGDEWEERVELSR